MCWFLGTYVHVEIGIVNVETVGRLLEVDMGNAVRADIVVVDKAELRVGHKTFDKFGGSADVVVSLDCLETRLGVGDCRVNVLRGSLESESLEVHGAPPDTRRGFQSRRVSRHCSHGGEEAQNSEKPHTC